MLDPAELSRRIRDALPGAEVEVRDLTGTGDHFEARVVAPGFEGLGMLDQHQAVYRPLRDLLDSGVLHALALKTYTPDQWQQLQGRPRNPT
ncbi:MAG TPA: BolA family transcriptional regulator [Myxococcaceae bacterium]|jgi:stress-induced morphogen|nr:BolA family transcriptional regulator [Myxococcaceae bacterium]